MSRAHVGRMDKQQAAITVTRLDDGWTVDKTQAPTPAPSSTPPTSGPSW